MRRRFALAVIALHCLLLWLLAVGFRQPGERALPPLQFVSLWIDPPAPAPELPPPELPPKKQVPAQAPAVTPAPVPLPVTPPLEPRPDSTPTSPITAPLVDWAHEASIVARRAGEAHATPKRETFSEPPKLMPKKCVPKERSMEWKDEDTSKGGRCGLTIGMNCSATERANGHLLDDVKQKHERSVSSVPDPNTCD